MLQILRCSSLVVFILIFPFRLSILFHNPLSSFQFSNSILGSSLQSSPITVTIWNYGIENRTCLLANRNHSSCTLKIFSCLHMKLLITFSEHPRFRSLIATIRADPRISKARSPKWKSGWKKYYDWRVSQTLVWMVMDSSLLTTTLKRTFGTMWPVCLIFIWGRKPLLPMLVSRAGSGHNKTRDSLTPRSTL